MKTIGITIIMVCFIATALFAQQGPEMVRIQGGNFSMGSPANEAGRDSVEIQRQVTISTFQ
jgi:formylglycine-generating enzyme required for sulfatase activity